MGKERYDLRVFNDELEVSREAQEKRDQEAAEKKEDD